MNPALLGTFVARALADRIEWMNKLLVAITMGDPAGVGPETLVGAWTDPRLREACRRMAVGNADVLQRAVELLGVDLPIVEVSSPEDVPDNGDAIYLLSAGLDDASRVEPGSIDPRGGQAAYDALVVATELALAGRIDALTTAPLHKVALNEAGYDDPGHTEILARLCGVREFAMMLYLPPGGRVCGTRGLGDPRIAIAALNPHAGEQGLFGDEERDIIAPAVAEARRENLDVVGPLPADTLMARASQGEFDAVVAMYHDQGHIALKLLDMHRAVNITLGLPIVRTSVAHGTAFDLAWQGRAEAGGMVEAVVTAARLATARIADGRSLTYAPAR